MTIDQTPIDYGAILQTFIGETAEQLAAIEEELIKLEAQPADSETLNTIFRFVHTIKGSSACVELHSVSQYAHCFEDVLERLRDGSIRITGDSITELLQAVDCLRRVVADAVAGSEEISAEHFAVLQRLSTGARGHSDMAGTENGGLGPDHAAGRDDASEIGRHPDQASTLRVETTKLDRMLNLTTEIIIARGRLRQLLLTRRIKPGDEIVQPIEAIDRLFAELHELITKVRMVPLGPIFRQHARTVRDLAEATGKSARLVIEGGKAEVDTSIIERLRDPLMHMIRNAVDHGIEQRDVRLQRGKDPCGRVTVRAHQQSGSIVIQVSDDGAGLDRRRIINHAISRGIISESATLSDQEIYRLILRPGFSTAEAVTEISGRGVGMDIVRRNIEAIHGSIEVESRQGEGVTITIRLPLTLAIIDGFIVGVGDETYVVPMAAVTECLDMTDVKTERSAPGGLINLRGEIVPFLRLRKLFKVAGDPPDRESVLVVKHEAGQAGFAVDALFGEGQVVIKPLGKLFKRLPGVSGSTILGSGRVALVLDVPAIIRESAGKDSRIENRPS